ncbi:MAG: hypothetical protein L6W00_04145 [Lentisphaeria bacterium]|nr:MAG: hypothetical protein L6W00_04145 [Lentisphaeria bacterium]
MLAKNSTSGNTRFPEISDPDNPNGEFPLLKNPRLPHWEYLLDMVLHPAR